MIRTVLDRRFANKISGLRAEAAKLSHERDLLKPKLLEAKGDNDAEAFAEVADRIRSATKRFDAIDREIRQLIDRRYAEGDAA